MWKNLRALLEKNRFIAKLLNDYSFRTVIFSACSFLGSVAYASFNIALAIFSRSLWYGALACYHSFLVFLRGYVLISDRKADAREWNTPKDKAIFELKRYRSCGIIFIVLTICLIAMIVHIVSARKVFEYDLFIVYVIAAYTFYRIGVAGYNIGKARRTDDFTVRTLRNINLVTAITSFLTLQSIALTTFSHNVNIPFVNGLTGFIVCGLIVSSGIIMIVNATVRIKKLTFVP